MATKPDSECVYDPNMEMPPPEILTAALAVEKWFAEKGYTKWKLFGIESRD